MNIDWYEEIIQKAYDSKERRVNDGVYDISEIDFILVRIGLILHIEETKIKHIHIKPKVIQ